MFVCSLCLIGGERAVLATRPELAAAGLPFSMISLAGTGFEILL
jgi:hypothetical protein